MSIYSIGLFEFIKGLSVTMFSATTQYVCIVLCSRITYNPNLINLNTFAYNLFIGNNTTLVSLSS